MKRKKNPTKKKKRKGLVPWSILIDLDNPSSTSRAWSLTHDQSDHSNWNASVYRNWGPGTRESLKIKFKKLGDLPAPIYCHFFLSSNQITSLITFHQPYHFTSSAFPGHEALLNFRDSHSASSVMFTVHN